MRPKFPLYHLLLLVGPEWGAEWELTEKERGSSVHWPEPSAGFEAPSSKHHAFCVFGKLPLRGHGGSRMVLDGVMTPRPESGEGRTPKSNTRRGL